MVDRLDLIEDSLCPMSLRGRGLMMIVSVSFMQWKYNEKDDTKFMLISEQYAFLLLTFISLIYHVLSCMSVLFNTNSLF